MAILRNILAVIVGFICGSIVNMGIVVFVSPLFPLPEGVDPASMESIKANIDRFSFANFMVPFSAHALGTFVGAFFTALLARSAKLPLAILIGGLNLLGGIAAVAMIGGPLWFAILDLGAAYIPMSFAAAWLASQFSSSTATTNPTSTSGT